MMLSRLNNLLVFFFLFVVVSFVSGQDKLEFEDYLSKYKNQDEVVVLDKSVLKISDNKGALEIVKEDYFESLILTDIGSKNYKELFYDSQLSPVLEYDAYTVSKKGKKIKSNDAKEFSNDDSSIFYDGIKKNEVTFKSLEPGAKKVLKTKISYKDHNLLSRFIFQKSIPSENMVFQIEVDNKIDIGYKLFHTEDSGIEFEKEEKRKKTIYTWRMKNTSPFKYELARPGYLYTAPHIAVFIKDHEGNKTDAKFLGTVEDLFQYYQEFVDGINSDLDEDLQNIAKKLVEGKEDEREKVKAIYYWVKDNIKYVAYENGYEGFIPREANLVCERKFGDCKDMASIITAMCNSVGIDNVYLTWIGSRDLPYTYEELPTPAVDNHMIAAYIADGKTTFLDATDQETRFGLPSSFIQGKQAMIYLGKDKHQLYTVPVVSAEDNEVTIDIKAKIDGAKIIGSGVSTMAGIARSNTLARMSTSDDKRRLKSIKGKVRLGNNKFKILDHNEEFVEDRDELYTINFDYELDNYLVDVAGEKYLNMFLRELTLVDEFEDERVYPFVFEYKLFYNIKVNLELPMSSDIGDLPAPLNIDNGLFVYNAEYTKTDKGLILHYKIKLTKEEILPSDFEVWNKSVKEIKKYMKQSIVVKNKS